MKNNAQVWTWVGILVVAAVVATVGTIYYGKNKQSGYPASVQAPQGQVVAGFPQELILDKKAGVDSSYSVAYASDTNQYTAKFNSQDDPREVYSLYRTYFFANGWTLLNASPMSTSSPETIYAQKDNQKVSIVITAVATSSSQIVVGYLK